MRICLILLILFNSAFLFGKSSEFGSGTIAIDGDSTSVFKPKRELYFSCFSPFPFFPKYGDDIWRYMFEVNYGKSLNKWLTINHNLFFLGSYSNGGTIPRRFGGEFYEFTLSNSLKLNKKGTFRFDFAYGIFSGNFRSYYACNTGPPLYDYLTERIIYFGLGPSFKGKLRYNFTNSFALSISSNYRTFFGFGATNKSCEFSGYDFTVRPLWQYLQIGIDIKLGPKKESR